MKHGILILINFTNNLNSAILPRAIPAKTYEAKFRVPEMAIANSNLPKGMISTK